MPHSKGPRSYAPGSAIGRKNIPERGTCRIGIDLPLLYVLRSKEGAFHLTRDRKRLTRNSYLPCQRSIALGYS